MTFFERSGLPRDLLAKVWAGSDPRRQGFLDFPAFVRALELMSLAQVGTEEAPAERMCVTAMARLGRGAWPAQLHAWLPAGLLLL